MTLTTEAVDSTCAQMRETTILHTIQGVLKIAIVVLLFSLAQLRYQAICIVALTLNDTKFFVVLFFYFRRIMESSSFSDASWYYLENTW